MVRNADMQKLYEASYHLQFVQIFSFYLFYHQPHNSHYHFILKNEDLHLHRDAHDDLRCGISTPSKGRASQA